MSQAAAFSTDFSHVISTGQKESAIVPRFVPLLLVDIATIGTSWATAILVAITLHPSLDVWEYVRLSFLLGMFPAAYALAGLYSRTVLHPAMELQGLFRSTTLAVSVLAAVSWWQSKALDFQTLVLALAWLLSVALVPFGRLLAREALSRAPWWGNRAVILCSGEAGMAVARRLHKHRAMGLRCVAMLNDSPPPENASDLPPYAGGFDAAPALAQKHGVRYAILALPGLPSHQLAGIVEQYASRFHNVLIIPDLFGISSLGVNAKDLGGILGVELQHRLLYRVPRLTKRVFDLFVAAAVMLLLAPLFIVLWLAIRLTSSGPALFSHARVGENGEEFRAWKFRTMYRNSDELLQELLALCPEARAEWARDSKLKDDPRVTPIGRFLRKTSLDELPQLWNVLRGDMSLVGPRPVVAQETAKYGTTFALYKRVSPGITGLWQVSGRNNTTYEERVALDEYYVRNWSIWLDLYILCRTVKVVFTGEGAY
jgi:Undecaprenyl-phosphate galactose phosphotransferase WbaP